MSKLFQKPRSKSFKLKAPKPVRPPRPRKERRYRPRSVVWESRPEDFVEQLGSLLREWKASYQLRNGLPWDSSEFQTKEFRKTQGKWASVLVTLLQRGEPYDRILAALQSALDVLSYPVEQPWSFNKAYDAIASGRAKTYGIQRLRESLASQDGDEIEGGVPLLGRKIWGDGEPNYTEVPIIPEEEVYGPETIAFHKWLYRDFGKLPDS